MSPEVQPREKGHSSFWRACSYLGPHKTIVIISVLCAFIVGAALVGGLGTMLPIMRVLINGDSVQGWMDRQIVERRLGVRLADMPDKMQIIKVDAKDFAQQAGLITGELKPEGREATIEILALLANPQTQQAQINYLNGKELHLTLPSVPYYLVIARQLVMKLPPPSEPVKSIAAVFAILAAVSIFGNFVRFFQEYLSDKSALLAVNDIRRRLYDHVLHIPLPYFTNRGTSDVTSRLAQDTMNLQEGFKTVFGQSIQEPIKAGMALGLAMFLDWRLTLFIIAFAPIMAMLIKKFGKKMRRASRLAMQSSAKMLGQIEGTLNGIRVVKGFNAERYERRRYTRIMDALTQEALRMSRIDAMSAPIIESLTLLVSGAIVLYAAYLVLKVKTLDGSTFIMLMICLAAIGESLRRCSKINNALQRANAAAARIFETMDLPVERPRQLSTGNETLVVGGNARPRIKLPTLQKEVRFENVTFSYPNAPTPAISDLNLTVPCGQSIAVVGRNGSGKTTLLALLPRFYDPQQGRILIDGVDITDATLKSLRSQISIVTQDSVIFPGTITQNIAYGLPHADQQSVIEAAKRAFAHEFIMEKPQGYDTMLGEMGGQLSGGQKQRICIARAIFKNSPILILDEATSQVDAESEELIQQAIESVMHGRTTFVIAHRLHTIKSADIIVVMDRGRIIGQGRHEDLLTTCEVYQQLYERQLFAIPTGEGTAATAS